jgi:hypothetical protein
MNSSLAFRGFGVSAVGWKRFTRRAHAQGSVTPQGRDYFWMQPMNFEAAQFHEL